LTIRNIAVFNHVSYNNDGLNIDSCRDVTITGCRVDSDDDGIVLKSLSRSAGASSAATATRSSWARSRGAIDQLDAAHAAGAAAAIRFTQVRDAVVRGCHPPATVTPFLKLEGPASRRVSLTGNDLRRVQAVAEIAPDVPADALSVNEGTTVPVP
jgi:hypothetical protein